MVLVKEERCLDWETNCTKPAGFTIAGRQPARAGGGWPATDPSLAVSARNVQRAWLIAPPGPAAQAGHPTFNLRKNPGASQAPGSGCTDNTIPPTACDRSPTAAAAVGEDGSWSDFSWLGSRTPATSSGSAVWFPQLELLDSTRPFPAGQAQLGTQPRPYPATRQRVLNSQIIVPRRTVFSMAATPM